MAIPAALRQDLSDIPLLEDSASREMRSGDVFWFLPRCERIAIFASLSAAARLADPYGLMNPGKLKHRQARDMRAIA